MNKKISMSDIANKVGVSVSTVSRVINNQPGIGAETRNKVLEIAREMNLISKTGSLNQTSGRTGNIGIIGTKGEYSPRYSTPSHITVGILEEAEKAGYHMITNLVYDDVEDINQLPFIREKKVDGVIIIGPNFKSSFIIDLYNSGIPLVLFDAVIRGLDIDCILHDNENPVNILTEHLINKHDHKNIAFISGPESWVSSRERSVGYLNAVNKASLKPHLYYMQETTIESGYEIMKKVLKDFPEITAGVAVNDSTAIGCIKACKEAGLRVPEDISITGFDDIQWASYHDPSMTTVKTFAAEMGRQACKRLIDLIDKNPADEHIGLTLRVGGRLIYRRSCGCTE